MKLKVLNDYRRDMSSVKKATLQSLRDAGIQRACKPGCSWCCSHAIPFIPPYEGAALAELVRSRKDLADVPERLLEQARKAAALRAEVPDILWPLGTFPCVFLSERGECRIYHDRPFECVVAYSLDAEACKQEALTGVPGQTPDHKRPWDGNHDDRVLFGIFKNMPAAVRSRMLARCDDVAGGENAPMFVAVAMFLFREELDRMTDELCETLAAKGAL